MNRRARGSWWGLYALLPITIALLYIVGSLRMGAMLRQILLVGVMLLFGLLASLWAEKHRDLLASEGVDAQAEEDALRALGVDAGRLAPSLTARQAHYRRTMLARHAARPRRPGEQG